MDVSQRISTFLLGAMSALLLVVVVFGLRPDWLPHASLASARLPTGELPPAIGAPGSLDRGAQRATASDSAMSARAPAGRLLIPVAGVERDQLVDTYAQARGQGRRHDAIDIVAPRGTPVLAAGDGVVLKLFDSDFGGITLYQLAPDGRTIYYYAHLDRYAPGIAEGQQLRRGDTLGYVGDTGNASPGSYHLHFAVSTTADPARYWEGVPQNPFPLLNDGGESL